MANRDDNNFKKAWNELMGYTEKEEPKTAVKEEQEPIEILIPKPVDLPVAREEAVIPSDMVINGNITTQSNMRIMGSIMGDVSCDGSIWLMGNIQGKVEAGNLTIQRGGLTGDADIRESVVIEHDAVLRGNLTAQNFNSNGCSEGEIRADNLVELRESAYVHGNITASALTVSTGAKIKGLVDVSENNGQNHGQK